MLDNISERIRLLYVALTRAKEKMIIVCNLDSDNHYPLESNGVLDNRIRKKYRSFKDIMLSGNVDGLGSLDYSSNDPVNITVKFKSDWWKETIA